MKATRTRILARTLTATLGLSLVAGTLWGASAVQDRELKDNDLKKLASALGEYLTARIERSGITEAEAEVRKQYESINGKKLKKARVQDLLAFPSDLGHALWMSGKFAKARTKKGKINEVRYEEGFFSESDPLEYAIWTPSKYSAKQSYSLILSIPDAGVDPEQHIIERWQAAEIKDNCIIAAPRMPGKGSAWTEQAGIARVVVLIKAVSDTHAVDPDRTYLCGRGAGVAAALAIGEFFPDRFAGIIGRAGDPSETSAINFRNIPTFFAGGGGMVTKFSEAIEAAGYGNCTVDADGLEPDIWNWMQANPRNAYPDEVTLVPGKPFPTRSAWLQVQPVGGEDVRVDAKVDRGTNTITITGKGVTEARVYFNDSIVDLSRPVVVIANGVESTAQIPRSLNTVLDLMFKGTIDGGRVYVAAQSYHLKPLAEEEDEGEEK
ncbi:MAG: hypothetical protein GY711_09605 [bacterium]|nr:hypothetical protein [bacterium]